MQQYTLCCQTLCALRVCVCVCVWWVFVLPSLHLLKSVLLFNLFVSHFFLFLFLLRSLLLLSTLYLFFLSFSPPLPPTATTMFDILVSPINCYTRSVLEKKRKKLEAEKEMQFRKVYLEFQETFHTFSSLPL